MCVLSHTLCKVEQAEEVEGGRLSSVHQRRATVGPGCFTVLLFIFRPALRQQAATKDFCLVGTPRRPPRGGAHLGSATGAPRAACCVARDGSREAGLQQLLSARVQAVQLLHGDWHESINKGEH